MSRSALSSAFAVCALCAATAAGCAAGDDHAGDRSTASGSVTPSPSCDDPPCYSSPESVGSLTSDVVTEVSGMAASVRTPGVYYVVGDEAGTSQVAAVREDGSLVGRITLDGMDAANAEAMAVGECGGGHSGSCLYVGDIGDHVGRSDVVVHRTPEPDLAEPLADVASDELRYTYPDGPTDAEALMVDDAGRPLIISKATFDRDTGQTGPTWLYRGSADGGELEALAEIDLPEPTDGVLAGLVGNVVTGASAADGSVLVRTYDEVLEYRAPDSATEPADFPAWPLRLVPAPAQIQSETIIHRVRGCGYLTTSELTGDIHAVSCGEGDQ